MKSGKRYTYRERSLQHYLLYFILPKKSEASIGKYKDFIKLAEVPKVVFHTFLNV
jgi:hypothetical protein